MSFFKNKTKELENQLEASTNEVTELTTELETLKADLINKDEELATLTASKAELNERVEELEKELEAANSQNESLRVDNKDFEAEVGKKAQETLASFGAEAVETSPEDESNNSQKSLMEIFNELTGKERSAFYQEHRDEILKQNNLK